MWSVNFLVPISAHGNHSENYKITIQHNLINSTIVLTATKNRRTIKPNTVEGKNKIVPKHELLTAIRFWRRYYLTQLTITHLGFIVAQLPKILIPKSEKPLYIGICILIVERPFVQSCEIGAFFVETY